MEVYTEPQVFHPKLRFKSQFIKEYEVMGTVYTAVIRVDNSPSRDKWINLKIFEKVYEFVINQERIDFMRSNIELSILNELLGEVARRLRNVHDNKPDMIGAAKELSDLYSMLDHKIRNRYNI